MILPFTGKVTRGLVVIPDCDGDEDRCQVVAGGFPADFDLSLKPGPLWLVLRSARDWGQGLPITIHPECKRRAAA